MKKNLVGLLVCCLVVWLSGVVCRFGWKPIPSVARVTRDEVSGLRQEGRSCLEDSTLLIMRLVISMSLYVSVLSSRQSSLSASYIPRLRPGLLSLRSVLSSRQILLCSCFVGSIGNQQNNKTTKRFIADCQFDRYLRIFSH